MNVYTSQNIKDIDSYSEAVLGIPTITLMERAGRAIAREVEKVCKAGSKILVLTGKGNNGGDGYAAAALLYGEYDVRVCDVFGEGQRSEAGKYFLNKYLSCGGKIMDRSALGAEIASSDVIVDAIFGVGFSGIIPDWLRVIAEQINSSAAFVLAVDVPLGVYSDTAALLDTVVRADVTVALTGLKPCHLSYPAAEYVGRVITDTLGTEEYISAVPTEIKYRATDASLAAELIPKRSKQANKGSFGRVLHFTGSELYPGAAHLSLEGSLRMGAGYVSHAGSDDINRELRMKFPEALFVCISEKTDPVSQISDFSAYSSILVGCGLGTSERTAKLCLDLIGLEGGPLILDADAINSVARYYGADILLSARRKVILTPHPLEFSRLSGIDVSIINSSRISVAENFAAKYGVVLLLKGAGTIITDGVSTYINSTGSSALAKAGSGDVLSGMIAALVATDGDTVSRVALAAYLHGRAADELSSTLSEYGVLPSELPRMAAEIISELTKQR